MSLPVPDTEARQRAPLFHPLAGSKPAALLRTLAQNGAVMPSQWHRLLIMLISCFIRWPSCILDDVRVHLRQPDLEAGPPPVFIVGHWRSGTTLLHNLLSRDPGFVFPTLLEVISPYDFYPTPISRRLHDHLIGLFPQTRPMDDVPFSSDLPQEEEVALAAMGAPSFFNCFYFPREAAKKFSEQVLFDGCTDADIERWHGSMKFFLEKIVALRPGRRLLLKNPANSARIPEIRRLFPSAKFIHIQRHPLKVFNSTRKLYRELLPLLALQPYDINKVDHLIFETYPLLMDRLLADWERLPERDRIVVRYEDLVSSPVSEIEKIYRVLGVGDFNDCCSLFEEYLRQEPIQKSRTMPPDEGTTARLRAEWGAYFVAMGYAA